MVRFFIEFQAGLKFDTKLPVFMANLSINLTMLDLPEAEGELVAGYNIEYASMGFALFFLGEYSNMILMSSITTVLFLGGWLPLVNLAPFTWIPGVLWFGIKVSLVLFCL